MAGLTALTLPFPKVNVGRSSIYDPSTTGPKFRKSGLFSSEAEASRSVCASSDRKQDSVSSSTGQL